jgi:hypothetical protein
MRGMQEPNGKIYILTLSDKAHAYCPSSTFSAAVQDLLSKT